MADAPERVWIGLRGVNTYKADHFDTEYLRADLIDMDVLRRVEEGMAFARNRLEMIANGAWNGDARDFKRSIPSVFSDFDAAHADLRAMMEKINE